MSLDSLLKKIGNVKRTKRYYNTLLDCCKIIEKYMYPLSKKFPELKNIYKAIINTKHHHLPFEETLTSWSRKLSEYLTYIKNNEAELKPPTIF